MPRIYFDQRKNAAWRITNVKHPHGRIYNSKECGMEFVYILSILVQNEINCKIAADHYMRLTKIDVMPVLKFMTSVIGSHELFENKNIYKITKAGW